MIDSLVEHYPGYKHEDFFLMEWDVVMNIYLIKLMKSHDQRKRMKKIKKNRK